MQPTFTSSTSAAGFRSLGKAARAQLNVARSIAEQAKAINAILESHPNLSKEIRPSLISIRDKLIEEARALTNNAVRTSETAIGIISDSSSDS